MGLCSHKQYEEVAGNSEENYPVYHQSTYVVLDVRTLNEEIERASAKLYQRIRLHDSPTIEALGNDNIHMHYS
jgi:hypothetical protein